MESKRLEEAYGEVTSAAVMKEQKKSSCSIIENQKSVELSIGMI